MCIIIVGVEIVCVPVVFPPGPVAVYVDDITLFNALAVVPNVKLALACKLELKFNGAGIAYVEPNEPLVPTDVKVMAVVF